MAVTINVNAWSDAGHAVNHLYDILYMMGRDDIPVVVGGDDGISDSGTIHPNVGGYFPLIDQGMATFGGCRYRQAIPLEGGGRLDVNTNFGIRRGFLPQGHRRYIPLQQPTVQQVMIDTISAGPTTVILIGAHTNFAIFLMTNPHLKRNVEHMYIMGGGVRSKNPTGCCPKNATTSCTPEQCGDHGNLFTSYSTNPNAEFNIFGDPFAAYQVFHSGIPITLVPLDATNTIPINEKFFYEFKRHQSTYEAQYCFKSLKIARDTWFNDQFYTDGYTKEVSGPEAAHIRVATKAKLNVDKNSPLDREFFKSFLEALNVQENSGRFDFKAQFPFYGEILYRPNFKHKNIGRPVIVDMDMSPGDLISLIYLLKAPIEAIDVKGILVSGNGWANVASIDIIYDILHMMGRDDIPVGHGNTTALGTPSYGCDYVSIIPQGSGGLIDSDTLYGLARSLPRSPRRYTAENSVKHGAPRNTDHPELRQPLAFEVWHSIKEQLDPSEKITILTNGPLTNLANIVLSDRDASSLIEKVYVVGGHIRDENDSKGNVFTVPSNRYAEFNMFLDPLAAKTILESSLDIALIPLSSQRRAASFPSILEALMHADHTPESSFVHHLLLLLHDLQLKHRLYRHMDMFLGEVLGAVYLVEGLNIKPSLQLKPISIVTNSTASTDGQIVLDKQTAGSVKVLVDFSTEQYYSRLANSLGNKEQSAVIGSFEEQIAVWSRPPQKSGT
uniref:Inosine/uridine-preferring nucleoside hydrolase domain-containing protein n=1 Tax=Setaria viridis TaxID=4556 RepID=A0A4U6VF50_SETVI|nr:hypothetical protein SEVIR_3G252700v2 [Setaria viridis]